MRNGIPKLAFVFGTRPEAVKLAPLIIAAKKRTDIVTEVCVTGQHRQMLDVILSFFEIKPDVDFDLMRPNQGLASLTAAVLEKVTAYLETAKPDYVIVQGDTTTVMATTLAAFYCKVKVVHVEAGLRTWNLQSPFPEEMNRVVASKLAAIHCAPTSLSAENLAKEHITAGVHITGNTVIDALLLTADKVNKQPPALQELPADVLNSGKRIVLITGHRRESFGDGFESICRAINELAVANPDVLFIYPVHLNPNVQQPVFRMLGNMPNIILMAPLDYPAFVYMMLKSYLILSDSGGVQEEAPSLGKPVLVMRENTERPEGVTAGVVKLVGTGKEEIVNNVQLLLDDEQAYAAMATFKNPYGDGQASERILTILMSYLQDAGTGN